MILITLLYHTNSNVQTIAQVKFNHHNLTDWGKIYFTW